MPILVLYIILIKLFLQSDSFKFRKVIGYIIIGTGTIIGMLRLYLLDRSFLDVLKLFPSYMYSRICISATKAHAHVIQIFPDQHDFFYGTAFANPGHLLPFEPVNLSQFLGYWLRQRLENYSSPSFSQGYANFGIAGFLLIVTLMFFQLLLFQFMFRRLPKNSLFLTFYVLIIPNMIGYASTSIQAVFEVIFVLFCITSAVVYYFAIDTVFNIKREKKMQQVENCNL